MSSSLHLYGPLAEKFGSTHNFAVDSLGDCIVMLTTQFSKAELKKEFSMHDFELIRNDDGLGRENIKLGFKGPNEFHLIPIALGSDKGVFNFIAGVALIAISFYIPPAGALGYGILTAGTVGMFGVGLLLSGIGYMMAPPIDSDYSDRNQVDERPSYVFNGPVNSTEQGVVIPLVCGEFMCGSVVIASELQNEDI